MKAPVYGKNLIIEYFDNAAGAPVEVFETQSFNVTFEDEMKANRALGESGRGVAQVLDGGGTISIDGKHTDPALMTFAIKQSNQVKGGNKGQSGKQPYTLVRQTITYQDGTSVTISYKGAVFYNYSNSVGEAHEEMSETIQISFDTASIEGDGSGLAANRTTGQAMHDSAVANVANLVSQQLGLEEYGSGDNLALIPDISQRIS